MKNQRQAHAIGIVFCTILIYLCSINIGLADSRLAIFLMQTGKQMEYRFLGEKQEFTTVLEQLKKAQSIDGNLQVAFIVQNSDVTVQCLVELIYQVHALGFTNITIETSPSRNETYLEDIIIRKVQVVPINGS